MKSIFNLIKMNIPVRFQNWAFWLGLCATILAAMNVSPEMFTSWELVGQELINLISNPFRLGCVVVAVVGVLTDPTTPGISDSTRALNRNKLGQD